MSYHQHVQVPIVYPVYAKTEEVSAFWEIPIYLNVDTTLLIPWAAIHWGIVILYVLVGIWFSRRSAAWVKKNYTTSGDIFIPALAFLFWPIGLLFSFIYNPMFKD